MAAKQERLLLSVLMRGLGSLKKNAGFYSFYLSFAPLRFLRPLREPVTGIMALAPGPWSRRPLLHSNQRLMPKHPLRFRKRRAHLHRGLIAGTSRSIRCWPGPPYSVPALLFH